jgi:hypothetical protein
MSGLEPRGNRSPRRAREQRAFRLVQVGGVAGLVTVVGAILAFVGVISGFIPFVALIVTIVCALMFRSATR